MADATAKDKARAWILMHPDETKSVQAVGAGVSESMIALVRRELIAEGKLPGSRKRVAAPAPVATAGPTPVAESAAPLLDHDAMIALADIDLLVDLDDDEIQQRMLKQCIRFAFDPKLHPDTRMTAHEKWAKLKDRQKAKDLGPGAPVTREAVLDRYTDLTRSIADIDLCVAALFSAYPHDEVVKALSAALDSREGTPA